MFEDKTYESILNEMLDQVDPGIDTRQGSIIYDALAPMAASLAQAYIDLDTLLNECFADTASLYYLAKRAAERGIFAKEGTKAVLWCTVTPSDAVIPANAEFNIGELNYIATQHISGGIYELTCTTAGEEGNNTSDMVVPLEYISGLESIVVDSIVAYGTDDETAESLRERYFDSFTQVAFGGNKASYVEACNSISGVTATKVYPAWDGGGTVKCTVLGSDYMPASPELVAQVQEVIDPAQDGSGVGTAPIGHVVTIDTVTSVTVNISANITYISGYSWTDIAETATANLTEYIRSLRAAWEDSSQNVVRTGMVENILLDITGVEDVTSVTLNGEAGNLIIDVTHVPVLGTVND